MIFDTPHLAAQHELWLQAQTTNVIRWGDHRDRPVKHENGQWVFSSHPDGPIRLQNDCQHSLSVQIIGAEMLHRFRTFDMYDGELILHAIKVHELGEILCDRDVPYPRKSAKNDLEEYLSVIQMVDRLQNRGYAQYTQRAFLLQFAPKHNHPDYQVFPTEALGIMKNLMLTNSNEVHAFEAIELWDYFMYAWEQYRDRNNELVILDCARNCFNRMDQTAQNVRGFQEFYWTDDLRQQVQQYMDEHAHVPQDQAQRPIYKKLR